MQVTVKATAFSFFKKGLPLVWITEILTEYWKQKLLQKNARTAEFLKSKTLTLLLPEEFQLLLKT